MQLIKSMRVKQLSQALLLVGLSYIVPVQAHETMESHGAHVHGVATMTIGAVDKTLEIQIESPAINFVGFEHIAETAEQKKAVKQVENQLADAEQQFVFLGAGCELVEHTSSLAKLLNDQAHEAKHEHEHHHDHEHEEEHHHEHGHHDIKVSYVYQCAKLDELANVKVNLFNQFEDLHELDVAWIVNDQTGTTKLNKQNNVVQFQ